MRLTSFLLLGVSLLLLAAPDAEARGRNRWRDRDHSRDRDRDHHHSDSCGHHDYVPVYQPPPFDPGPGEALIQRVYAQTFSSDKMGVIQDAVYWGTPFTSDQVARVLDGLTFSSDKMEALELLAPRIVDPWNGGVIADGFTFSSDRERARQILRR